MAGMRARISRVFGSGKDDSRPADDQKAPFEDHFAEQTELLQQVRRGAASVAASRKLLAQQLTRVAAELDSLTLTARRSLQQGREDLAREALLRRQGLARQLAALECDHGQLQLEEERLVLTSTRLQAKLDTLRARQETDWATYSAVEAQARVDEALQAMSADVGNAGQTVQRAAASARASEASAAATDMLLSVPAPIPADDQAELAARAEKELAAMKAELASDGPVQAGQGVYSQPGQEEGTSPVQDVWGLEEGER